MKKYCFGADIGGTTVKLGLFDQDGIVLDKWEIPTRTENEGIAILPDMAASIKEKIQEHGLHMEEIAGIGVDVPGPISEDGIVPHTANLGWGYKEVTRELTELTGLPSKAGNDANVAALGEMWLGGGKGHTNVLMITLGTGVGGGIIIDGKIFSGFNSAGAEIGHTVIVKGGRPCMCGRRGCWEKYASARALAEDTLAAMEQHKDNIMWSYVHGDPARVNAKTAFDAMRAGDALGTQVVQNFVEYVACGLTNLINIFQPEIICIGGGVSKEGDTLLAPVQAVVDQEDYAREGMRRTKIVTAKLRNDAGIIGAAGLATQHQ